MEYGDPAFMKYSDRFLGSICPFWHAVKVINDMIIKARSRNCQYISRENIKADCYVNKGLKCTHPRHPRNLKIEDVVVEEL